MCQDAYWFARGYYDGRVIGTECVDDACSDGGLVICFYKLGYEAGVADYCRIELSEI